MCECLSPAWCCPHVRAEAFDEGDAGALQGVQDPSDLSQGGREHAQFSKATQGYPQWVQSCLCFFPWLVVSFICPERWKWAPADRHQRELLEGAVQNPGRESLGPDFCNVYPGADCGLCFAFNNTGKG